MTELAHGHRRAHTAPALNTKLCRHAVNYTLLSSDRNSLRLLKDCCSKLTSLTADKARDIVLSLRSAEREQSH